jgi:hypothetical protein
MQLQQVTVAALFRRWLPRHPPEHHNLSSITAHVEVLLNAETQCTTGTDVARLLSHITCHEEENPSRTLAGYPEVPGFGPVNGPSVLLAAAHILADLETMFPTGAQPSTLSCPPFAQMVPYLTILLGPFVTGIEASAW